MSLKKCERGKNVWERYTVFQKILKGYLSKKCLVTIGLEDPWKSLAVLVSTNLMSRDLLGWTGLGLFLKITCFSAQKAKSKDDGASGLTFLPHLEGTGSNQAFGDSLKLSEDNNISPWTLGHLESHHGWARQPENSLALIINRTADNRMLL